MTVPIKGILMLEDIVPQVIILGCDGCYFLASPQLFTNVYTVYTPYLPFSSSISFLWALSYTTWQDA